MTGRPRSFDRDKALDLALEAFWERGFDSTSIAHLTGTMGIAPPSLYKAFGDKQQLFDEAVDRYVKNLERGMTEASRAASAQEFLRHILNAAADHYTARECPRGCLVMSEPLLAEQRAASRAAIAARIHRGHDEGDLSTSTDPNALAEFIDTVLAGMSARARDGATREQLQVSIDLAMSAAGQS